MTPPLHVVHAEGSVVDLVFAELWIPQYGLDSKTFPV